MSIRRAAFVLTLICLVVYGGPANKNGLVSGVAGTDPTLIPNSGWQTFSWNAGPNAPNLEGPFTFTVDQLSILKITDAFCRGDQFRVFDNGVALTPDTTSVPTVLACTGTTSDPDVAFADPTYSHGVYFLAPGAHSITIQTIVNPFGGGAAFLRLDPVARDVFQVRYASNLGIGDSVVNLTNVGAATLPTGLTTTGNLCVNVYTFDESEELISCCSCLVTPNGLNSLSARADLISNTLTPGVPTSIVIKLIASVPLGLSPAGTGGTCNPSAPTPLTLAQGIRAWGTTLHSLPTTPVSYGLTETRFDFAPLSPAELTKLTTFCGFIQANGSGFGICKSCRTGGLGTDAR